MNFDENPQSSEFKKKSYSDALRALGEPSLAREPAGSTGSETYRFLWLRTFHHPVCIRIDISSNGTSTLTTKISSGKGGYDPGKLIVNRKRRLTRDQTRWFVERIKELGFWSLPTYEKPTEATNPNGEKALTVNLDGAQWILEGVNNKEYHVVDRWSPENGAVRTLGITMVIDLANFKLLYQDVY